MYISPGKFTFSAWQASFSLASPATRDALNRRMLALASIFLFLLSQAESVTPNKPKFNFQNFMENKLETGLGRRQRFRKNKPKAHVTIVIGIICKEGILVGSDSRTTNPDHTIRDNAIKVRLLRLAGPDNAIIAQAGDDDLGSRVVDRIEHLAEQAPLTDWQTVSDIGDRAIADEQKKLRTPFEGVGFSMEEFQNVLRGHDATFLLAYYFKGKPYIFTTDFYPRKFTRRQSSHFSTGCGSPLANFLLEGFDFSKLNIWEATAIP